MKTSNPQSIDDIITDILVAQGGFWNERLTRNERDAEVATAKQALYEAVVAQKPEYPYIDYGKEGFAECNELWLTNLAALFGISKEGVDTE